MLSEQEKLQFLQETDLFANVPSKGLMSICQIAQELDFSAGEILFEEGDQGDSLYLLVDGEAAIIKGNIEVMVLREPGSCIGEMALIDNEPRSARVKMVAATKLLKIPRKDIYEAMRNEFSIARGMFTVLNEKLRRDTSALMSAYRNEIAQQESMRLAAEVQKSLLPEAEIDHPLLMTAGYCQPANSVGGDYYDYIPLSDGRLAIFLGDVMGHGVHSAMLMAMSKSSLHTQIAFDASVHGVMSAVNRSAEYDTRTFIYLTCCYVVIDLVNQTLEFANAGHPPMFLYRTATQEIVELQSQVYPLGLLPTPDNMTYEGEQTSWEAGDVLVLYSDGITETEDLADELYGTERLKKVISRSAHFEPPEIKDAILADIDAYRQGNAPEDDITLVVAKWK